jgi:hypothetical protein
MFDPLVPGYWLIGPNRETGDTFYLCHECTRFMEDTPQALATSATSATSATPTQRIDEDDEGEDYSYDSEDYQDDEDEPQQGDYDHSEECS